MTACRLVKRLLPGIFLTSNIVLIIIMVKLQNNYKSKNLHQKLISESKFLVDTNACKIPRTPIWPEYIKKDWKIQKDPDCSQSKNLAKLNDSDQMLKIFSKYSNSSCCLSEVFPVDKNDNTFRLSNCAKIVDNIVNVSQMEMLVIKCGHDVNYEANFPMKSSVERKVKKWKNTKSVDLPINVLMIGVDTVSRSHAYRSIPRTMDLLNQMGFKDFLGFQSVGPSTLTNFIPLLMGLERNAMRKICAPNWKSPFDSCPFIWKDFSLNDYVTMYTEDGGLWKTFNWGGQSGFHTQPTDYYIHPMFIASDSNGCTSTETMPQFMFRYTSRFIQKFEQTPFFSFTWLNIPFHYDPYALSNLENDTFQFFDSLQSIPGFLKRTVVIFLSDHGDRTSYSDSKKGIEAYMERGLPPLFIRFPEIFKERHPELEFEQNVNFLTTPFDLHQTFLHILALQGFNVTTTPVDSRQSLFTRIKSDADRTCDTLHVWEGTCVCNVNVEGENDQLLNNPVLRGQIVGILGSELNRIVKSSKYTNVCGKWITWGHWISSVQIIKKTANHSELHVQFSADTDGVLVDSDHGIASFEAKIRIAHRATDNTTGSKDFVGSELIGGISRVNLYGNQSWCVGFATDADKQMKEYCICNPTSQVSSNITNNYMYNQTLVSINGTKL